MPNKQKNSVSAKQPKLDFSSVLAASIHDMKNSLFLLLQSIEQVSHEVEKAQPKQKLADIHYEAQRLNTNLMQLLSLYRYEQSHLEIICEEYFLDELGEELESNSTFYAEHYGIQLEIQVLSEGTWLFDSHLILLLLNDMLLNALRYAKSKVLVQIKINKEQALLITIHDDGPGYPSEMLQSDPTEKFGNFEIKSGRSGLGLYFSSLIAQAHHKNGRKGYVVFNNQGLLGGSQFTLWLP